MTPPAPEQGGAAGCSLAAEGGIVAPPAVQEACARVERACGWRWQVAFWLCAAVAAWGLVGSAFRLATEGVGLLGVNNEVPWGWDIVQFVFWIGIGHAGTLISSVLLLTHQGWRTSVARMAELMTLCAVVCAACFPLVHVGRIWMTWLISPVPVASGVWPDMGSALFWDVLAVGTYFLLSAAYWWIGMIPDCAAMRDACRPRKIRRFYAWAACGWQGSATQWSAYRRASLALALALAPLVVTVHSVVSLDFATTVKPGWHETMFPPFFVAGAILSGMAMVQLLSLWSRDESVRRVQPMLARYVLGFSWLMLFFYGLEVASALHEGGAAREVVPARLGGEHAWWFWAMVAGNCALPQLYWVRRWRSSRLVAGIVSLGVLAGMWGERVVIVIGSSLHSLIPGRENSYSPSEVDVAMLLGSAGLFVALFLLGSRRMPPEAEVPHRALVKSPAASSPAWAALAGFVAGVLLAALWATWTQDAPTSAVVQGRAVGWERWFSYVPALFVGGLLGSGVASVVCFFLSAQLPKWYDPGRKEDFDS